MATLMPELSLLCSMTCFLATASAHNCTAWAVWREGARLAILGPKLLSLGCFTPWFGEWDPSATDTRMPLVAKLVDIGSIGSYFESLGDPRGQLKQDRTIPRVRRSESTDNPP